jgi:hypothetical protein
MSISLGKDQSAPPVGAGIISASYTEEREVVDVSNRSNIGGAAGGPGYKANLGGFSTKTWEIECHDASGLIAALQAAPNSGDWAVMSVSENIAVDGAVTYNVTIKQA